MSSMCRRSAISTIQRWFAGGSSPSLAKRLREEMESAFGPEYEAWLRVLARKRQKILGKGMSISERMDQLKKQASAEAFAKFLKAYRK